MLKLYHGTNLNSAFNICVHGIDLTKSMLKLDFGKGFYVTDNKKKAINRAFKKTNDYNSRYKYNDDAYLVVVYLNENLLKEIEYKEFDLRCTEWYEFVINNRLNNNILSEYNITNHNKDNKYDIVYGEIADNNVAKLANDIENGISDIKNIDYSKIIPIDEKNYGNQYSFHTEKSLSCIESISCAIIKSYRKKVN